MSEMLILELAGQIREGKLTLVRQEVQEWHYPNCSRFNKTFLSSFCDMYIFLDKVRNFPIIWIYLLPGGQSPPYPPDTAPLSSTPSVLKPYAEFWKSSAQKIKSNPFFIVFTLVFQRLPCKRHWINLSIFQCWSHCNLVLKMSFLQTT